MADWQISPGTTDVTLSVRLRDAFNGSPKTGLTITNLQIRYIRVETDNDVIISAWQTLGALASLTANHADNGGYEIGEGCYQIDIPDAVCASGADYASVLVQDSVNNSILVKDVELQLASAKMNLADDAITSAKYDESTAFPISEKAKEAAATMVLGTVVADGGNSTTQFKTDLTEGTKDHYNDRIIIFRDGNLARQATDITGYDGDNKIPTVTQMTEIPSAGDKFVIV